MRRISLVLILMIASVFLCGCGIKSNREVANCENAAIEFTIHTFDGSYGGLPLVPNFGHSFLSVKNLTDGEITVGNFLLGENCEVAVGTWGQSAHTGVWYNLESKYYEIGKYNSCVTLTKTLDLERLEILNKHILENDRWAFNFNCTAFSVAAWNKVSDGDSIKIRGIESPVALKKRIKQFRTHKGAKYIENYSVIGYYSNGSIIQFELESA